MNNLQGFKDIPDFSRSRGECGADCRQARGPSDRAQGFLLAVWGDRQQAVGSGLFSGGKQSTEKVCRNIGHVTGDDQVVRGPFKVEGGLYSRERTMSGLEVADDFETKRLVKMGGAMMVTPPAA